jgi:YD repeat-containing protein
MTRAVDVLGGARLTEYDRYGRILASTDELGHTTGYTPNEQGDPELIRRTDTSVIEAAYDALRKPTRPGQ